MKITIVGAGNMGLCLLGYLKNKGHQVVLYTTSTKLQDKTLILQDKDSNKEIEINGFEVTASIDSAFNNSDFIFCTYPAFLRKGFIHSVEDVIKSGSILCFVPGYGGAEFFCGKLLSRGVKICGLQRVPYVARYEDEGTNVYAKILSTKKRLYVASIPKESTTEIAKTIENLLNIPTTPLKEYLAVTMSPSNPLLHISGLYSFFGNKPEETVYPKEIKFYDEWDDSTSLLLFNYDRELHTICDGMKEYFDLQEIVPLSTYYESPTPHDMTAKLKSIKAFKVVKMPLKRSNENEYTIDLTSRMFVEDFPYGVSMFKSLANLSGIATPIVDELLQFYYRLSGKSYFNSDGSLGKDINETCIPQLTGIKNLKQLFDFYS